MTRERIGVLLLVLGAVATCVSNFLLLRAISSKDDLTLLCFALLLTEIFLLVGQGFADWKNPFSLPVYLLMFALLAPAALFYDWTVGARISTLIECLCLSIIFFGWTRVRHRTAS